MAHANPLTTSPVRVSLPVQERDRDIDRASSNCAHNQLIKKEIRIVHAAEKGSHSGLKLTACKAGIIALMILFCWLWCPIGAVARLYQEWNNPIPAVVEKLGKERHKAALKVLNWRVHSESLITFDQMTRPQFLKGNQGKLAPTAAKELTDQVVKIQLLLKQPPETGFHDYMQRVREEINIALKMPGYKALKTDERNPSVHFLHGLVMAISHAAEGQAIIQEFGNEKVEKCLDAHPELQERGGEFSWGQLGKILHHSRKANTVLSKDGLGKVAWVAAHPQKAFAALFGETECGAKEYNAFQHGNAAIHAWDYNVYGLPVSFAFGPGPTQDAFFQAKLQFIENARGTTGKLYASFQQSLESTNHRAERERIDDLRTVSEENAQNLTFSILPLDGDIWKGKGAFASDNSPEKFHSKLSHHMLGQDPGNPAYRTIGEKGRDNGFFIPESTLTDDEVRNGLVASGNAFTGLAGGGSVFERIQQEKRGNEKLCKAMLLGAEAVLSVRALYKMGEKIQKNNPPERLEGWEKMLDDQLEGLKAKYTMGQACKQDVDRGVILNIVTRIYMLELQGVFLTREEVSALVGSVLLRAEMVDGRMILEDRAEALETFLELVGDRKGDFIEEIRAYCQGDSVEELSESEDLGDRPDHNDPHHNDPSPLPPPRLQEL